MVQMMPIPMGNGSRFRPKMMGVDRPQIAQVDTDEGLTDHWELNFSSRCAFAQLQRHESLAHELSTETICGQRKTSTGDLGLSSEDIEQMLQFFFYLGVGWVDQCLGNFLPQQLCVTVA